MKNIGRLTMTAFLSCCLVTSLASAQDPAAEPVEKTKGVKPSKLKLLKTTKLTEPKRVNKQVLKEKPTSFKKLPALTPKMVKPKPVAPSGAAQKPPAKPIKTPAVPKTEDTTASQPEKDSLPPSWKAGLKDKKKDKEDRTLSKDFVEKCQSVVPDLPNDAKFTLDIYEHDIADVVWLIGCLTQQNIILPKSIKGKKITIWAPQKVTKQEAYRAFLTALETNGLTISRQGKFLRIIDIKDFARASDPLLPPGSTPPSEDRMVTQIVTLRHVDAGEINEVISKLATANAQFIVYQPNNSLIITETGSNLRKLKVLIKELDQPGGSEELWMYQVVNAEASEIAQKILEVFEKQDSKSSSKSSRKRSSSKKRRRGKGSKRAESTSVGESELDARVSKVIADERTNRLLIVATRRSYKRVKKLIKRLDIAVEGDGQVHIHQLNHAKAADISTVLGNLSSNQRSSSSRRTRKKRSSKKKSSKRSSSSTTSSAALFEGEVNVTADEDTNSLVITASLKDYLSLKKVIDVLDRPRRQVFIEAVVMEVAVENNREFGISSHIGYDPEFSGDKKGLVVFGNPGPKGGSILDLTSAASLTGLAVQGPPIEISGVSLPSFGAVMRALATNNDVNVLSTPHILTTDNEQAEIVVGDNVPFVSGFVGGGGGGLAGGAGGLTGGLGLLPTVNVQRQDVALTLKITPRINAASFVTLEIDQVVEEISRFDERLGPTTSKRSVKSTVVVKDQNTVVIGGLQKSKQSNSKTAFPFLGEIPIIGYLFRSSTKKRERVNLLLMLTPYVIEGPNDFKTIMKRKLEEHREFAARFHKKGDKLVLNIDYRKKHGVLESIRQTIREIRKEQELLEEIRRQEKGPPLPQDTDGIDDDDDSAQVRPDELDSDELAADSMIDGAE
ncbi:MAG: type II secretion system secretin GspD [Myxococcota bacterium]|nr:type II secretion system secretin GspD [Myxococcota bacterium]